MCFLFFFSQYLDNDVQTIFLQFIQIVHKRLIVIVSYFRHNEMCK